MSIKSSAACDLEGGWMEYAFATFLDGDSHARFPQLRQSSIHTDINYAALTKTSAPICTPSSHTPMHIITPSCIAPLLPQPYCH